MKKAVAVIFIAILPVFAFAATGMNLSDAISKRVVKMDAINTTGNYKGKAIKMTLTNNSSAVIKIKVDLGGILKPEQPEFQPLVLAGEEIITLQAHETGETDVEVFCDNAVKECPVKGLHYSFFRMGGDELIKTLRYVKDHDLFDHLGQAAVWAISNYHTLNNVYDPGRDSLSRRLIAHIVEVTRRPKPTYYTTSTDNEVPAQLAYIARTDRVYVPFEISFMAAGSISAGVFNAKGEKVKTIFEDRPLEPGKHNIVTEVNATYMEPGKYSVRIWDAIRTIQEKEIQVGP